MPETFKHRIPAPTLSNLERWSAKFSQVTFLLLTVAVVVLPSGYVAGVPVKHAAYLLVIGSFSISLISSYRPLPPAFLLMVVGSLIFIALFLLIGAQRNAYFGLVLQEASYFLTALSIPFLFYLAARAGWLSVRVFLSTVFCGVVLYAAWKAFAVIGIVQKWFTFSQVYAILGEQFNYRVVTSGIFGGLVRLNLIIYDFLCVLCIFAVIGFPDAFSSLPAWLRRIGCILLASAVFFAFSRYLFIVAAALLLPAMLISGGWRLTLGVSAGALLSAALGYEWLAGVFEQRFLSPLNEESDFARSSQISALVAAWEDAFLFGGGFGYYARDLIRDPSTPFSYEVQWVGFLAKFGVIGIFYLFLLCGMFASFLFRQSGISNRDLGTRVLLVGSLGLFLLGGLTNQYLVSSASGIVYSLLMALAMLKRPDAGLRR